jgi:hypothetical protein
MCPSPLRGHCRSTGRRKTQFLTGIAANTRSIGSAGTVDVIAGTLSIVNSGKISSGTFASGAAGSVRVMVSGPLTIDGSRANPGALATGIFFAGKHRKCRNSERQRQQPVDPQRRRQGGVRSTALPLLQGMAAACRSRRRGRWPSSGPDSGITVWAKSGASGNAGSVTVAAGSLTISGGAEIASSTAGPGKGGDVDVSVASDIVLPDPGPRITARSTGSGDAGSVTVSAFRLQLANGGAISTEAEASIANSGNITLDVGDFLYITKGEITTSVKGQTGNGGNIVIDPQFVVLNQGSSIIAQAIDGHGGNITIDAGEFLKSSNSLVSASSALGVSGTIEIIGRASTSTARWSCCRRIAQRRPGAAQQLRRAGQPPAIEPDRGGARRPAARPRCDRAGTLHRRPRCRPGAGDRRRSPATCPRQTIARLTMRCG